MFTENATWLEYKLGSFQGPGSNTAEHLQRDHYWPWLLRHGCKEANPAIKKVNKVDFMRNNANLHLV